MEERNPSLTASVRRHRRGPESHEYSVVPPRDLEVLKAQSELLKDPKWMKKHTEEREYAGKLPTPSEIAHETKLSIPSVKRSLHRLEHLSDVIEFARKAKKTRYQLLVYNFRMMYDSPVKEVSVAKAKVTRRQKHEEMLRRGKWNWGRRNIMKPYDVDEEKNITLPESVLLQNLRKAIDECVQDPLGSAFSIAKKHKVPQFCLYRVLDDPFSKGYISETEKGIHPALAPPERWDKAHAWFQLAREKKSSQRPFLGTEWHDEDIVANDPDDIIGQIVKIRLEKEAGLVGKGYRRIAKALRVTDPKTGEKVSAKISATGVQHVLKNLDFYVKLGMVSPEIARKVKEIKLPRMVDVAKKLTQARKDENRERIAATLDGGKRLRTYEIAKQVSLNRHVVVRHLRELKLVDREPGRYGRWFRKSPA